MPLSLSLWTGSFDLDLVQNFEQLEEWEQSFMYVVKIIRV